MAKFNRSAPVTVHDGRTVALAASSPILTGSVATGRTYEGAPGYVRDPRSELFLLAVTNMVGENTFYERAGARDERYENLVRQLAVTEPEWAAEFLGWLRESANMRSAAIVGAAHYVHARLTDGPTSTNPLAALAFSAGANRRVVDSVLRRADEPGEFLAYWTSRFGRAVPKPVKRGLGDAVQRMFTERNLLKYDTASHGFRFGDVLEVAHPSPHADKPWQGDLFRYAIDRRHGHDSSIPESLGTVRRNATLRSGAVDDPTVLLDAAALRAAAMTWEDALSLAGSRIEKAQLWEAMIPSMGYMALLRNLRNFDEAGVSDEVAATVAARLADPVEVAQSRQLPMRFLSAYRAAPSLRWAYPLEQALDLCLANIPVLAGRTLILIDTSGSMRCGFSRDGTLMRWDAAALFGVALAARAASADVVSFSNDTKAFPLIRGESLLKSLERWKSGGWFLNGGTQTAAAIRKHHREHDRIVIVTDEQAGADANGGVGAVVPVSVPMYTWNLAGYRYGHAPSGSRNRHTFGGLTDQAFRMIPMLERGESGDWAALFAS